MMGTINESAGDAQLPPETFNDVFNMWWPRLENEVEQILSRGRPSSDGVSRTDRELLEELLQISRHNLMRASNSEIEFGAVPTGLVNDLLRNASRLGQIAIERDLPEALEPIDEIFHVVEYLARMSPDNHKVPGIADDVRQQMAENLRVRRPIPGRNVLARTLSESGGKNY
jgi:hypothetical protein